MESSGGTRIITLWSSNKTLQFIKAYRDAPCLWNHSDEDYNNKEKRSQEIQKLCAEFDIDANEIERKLKSLKAQFRREKRRERECRRAGIALPQYTWFGYKPMLFLMQGLSRSKQIAEQQIQTTKEDEKIEEPPYLSENDITFPEPMNEELETNPLDITDVRLLPNNDEEKSIHENITPLPLRNEFTVFGEYVALKLRNLSSHSQIVAQHYINNVLFEAGLGRYERHFRDTMDDTNNYQSPIIRPNATMSRSSTRNWSFTDVNSSRLAPTGDDLTMEDTKLITSM